MGHRHKDHRKPKELHAPTPKAPTTKAVTQTPKTPVQVHRKKHEQQVVTSPAPTTSEDLPPRSWLEDVYQSVFEPGVNKGMEIFIHLAFAGLFASLAFLHYLLKGRDLHAWLLTLFAVGCYVSLCWLIREMRLAEQKEKKNN